METSYANPVAALDETRAELRAVAQKLASCERALEGHGVYLGIKDPATLLDQLKTLQRKDEQLREVLLIFLRAIPLQAPPLPIASSPPAPRPPASPAAKAPPSSPALAVSGQSQQQHPQPPLPPTQLQVRYRAADPVSEAGAAHAARGAARSSAPLTSGAARTVSLHEALGIPPPRNGEASAAEASMSSVASSQASAYRPGQHALYRTTGVAATDGGAARAEKEPARTSGRGARLAAVRVGSGSGSDAGAGAGAGAPMRYNIRVVGPAGGPSLTPRASPSHSGTGVYDRNGGVISFDRSARGGAAERARDSPSAAPPSQSSSSASSSSSSSSSSTAQPSPVATPVSAPPCARVGAPFRPSPRATAAMDGGHRAAERDNDDEHVKLGDGSIVIEDKSNGVARVAERAASSGSNAPPSSEIGAAAEGEASDRGESRTGGGGDDAATEVAERGDAPSPAERAVRGNQDAVREGPTPPERARTRASRSARRAASAVVGTAAHAARGNGAASPSEKGAGAAPTGEASTTIKNELMEDMREDLSGEVLGAISDRTDGLLAAGLVDAALRAAARTAAGVAVRPLSAAERERPILLQGRVKMEVADAVAEAVSHVARDTTPRSVMPSLVRTRIMCPAESAFMRNFDVPQDGDFVTRKVVDKARCSPPPPPPTSRPGSGPRGPARAAETVAIDHDDSGGEDEAAGSRGTLATQVDTPGTADEDQATAAAAEEEAAAMERRVESERVRGAGRRCFAAGSEQPSASQTRVAAGLSAGPASSQMSAATPAPAPRVPDVGGGSGEGRGGGGGSAAVPPNISGSGSSSSGGNSSSSSSSSSSSGNDKINGSTTTTTANNGRPPRKRRKSAEAGGWRGRYSKDEFYLGEASSDGGEDWTARGPEVYRSGKLKLASGTTSDGGTGVGDGGEESEGQLVDVGAEDEDDYDDDDLDDAIDAYRSAGLTAGLGGSGARKRRAAAPLGAKKKRSPPNAWKKRCADGNCQLGASFGMLGKPAMYCSAHRDAGMVNVTHRRCEEPGCIHQPSFNMFGMKKALFCAKHKLQGMVNVSSPRCESPGCMVRPSFGFESDRRASLCDTHKRTGMTNIRKKSRRKSSGMLGAGHGVVVEAAAGAAAASGAELLRFDSPFLSDSPSLAAAMGAATTAATTLPPPPFGDDDPAAHAPGGLIDGAGVDADAGIGGFGGGVSGAGRPGSFLDGAVDIGS